MTAVTLISLTARGAALAQRVLAALPRAEHLHRPKPFRDIVQQRFLSGQRLVLICATGIAVRTLGPVLSDKRRDPAVLVLDEHGRYVVPLLSGHEGGANDWAAQLAAALGAHCVITGAQRYTGPILVAGMGCERGCSIAALSEIMDHALASKGLARSHLHALASIEIKRDEQGILALAREIGVPCAFYPASQLRNYTDRLTTRSSIVFRETGCYGVAEAAALAHAESLSKRSAELLIPKQKNRQATFALARTYEDDL